MCESYLFSALTMSVGQVSVCVAVDGRMMHCSKSSLCQSPPHALSELLTVLFLYLVFLQCTIAVCQVFFKKGCFDFIDLVFLKQAVMLTEATTMAIPVLL